jgi:D-proline reductase (dithiol) PrdB
MQWWNNWKRLFNSEEDALVMDLLPVDSFKFLPRIISVIYEMSDRQPEMPIPWTPLPRPLAECVFGLITSGGLYHQGVEPPFDLEREKRDPQWGDPSYRTIPIDIVSQDLGVSHLHVNPQAVKEDINVLLPLDRFDELADKGVIGGLASKAYSFMGYQGYPPDTNAWRMQYGPQVADKLKSQGVDCVLLTPS